LGLPKGATSDKEWRSEIRKAVHELRSVPGENGAQPQKVRTLRLLARKLADRGLEGEIAALREIGDRLDGKPAQAIAITGDPDSPVIFNLRLGDGLKTIEHEPAPEALTAPLVAIAVRDSAEVPEE